MKTILLSLIILVHFSSSSQWVNLGNQNNEPNMIYNGYGYKITNSSIFGGSFGNLELTGDDWNSSVVLGQPGQNDIMFGLDVLNDSVLFYFEVDYQASSFLKRSINGGITNSNWGTFTIPTNSCFVNDTLAFVYDWNGQTLCRVTPSEGIVYLDNGNDPTVSTCSPEFTSPSTGYTAVFDTNAVYKILKTNDSGDNFASSLIDSNYSFNSISFPSDLIGYTCNSNGSVYKTNDAGLNWFDMNCPASSALNDIEFINNDVGIATGNAAIYRTIDGGNTWIIDSVGEYGNFIKVDIVNLSCTYIQSSNGDLFKSEMILSTPELKLNETPIIKINPNPTGENLNIELEADDLIKSIKIYSMKGEIVYEGNKSFINISSFSNGTYVVKVESINGIAQQRFVKK